MQVAEQDTLIRRLFDSQRRFKSITLFEKKLRADYEIAVAKGEVPILVIDPVPLTVAEGEPDSCAEDE